jgi:hypothetical protein
MTVPPEPVARGALCAACGRSWRGFTVYDGETHETWNACRDTPNADGTWNYHRFEEPRDA